MDITNESEKGISEIISQRIAEIKENNGQKQLTENEKNMLELIDIMALLCEKINNQNQKLRETLEEENIPSWERAKKNFSSFNERLKSAIVSWLLKTKILKEEEKVEAEKVEERCEEIDEEIKKSQKEYQDINKNTTSSNDFDFTIQKAIENALEEMIIKKKFEGKINPKYFGTTEELLANEYDFFLNEDTGQFHQYLNEQLAKTTIKPNAPNSKAMAMQLIFNKASQDYISKLFPEGNPSIEEMENIRNILRESNKNYILTRLQRNNFLLKKDGTLIFNGKNKDIENSSIFLNQLKNYGINFNKVEISLENLKEDKEQLKTLMEKFISQDKAIIIPQEKTNESFSYLKHIEEIIPVTNENGMERLIVRGNENIPKDEILKNSISTKELIYDLKEIKKTSGNKQISFIGKNETSKESTIDFLDDALVLTTERDAFKIIENLKTLSKCYNVLNNENENTAIIIKSKEVSPNNEGEMTPDFYFRILKEGSVEIGGIDEKMIDGIYDEIKHMNEFQNISINGITKKYSETTNNTKNTSQTSKKTNNTEEINEGNPDLNKNKPNETINDPFNSDTEEINEDNPELNENNPNETINDPFNSDTEEINEDNPELNENNPNETINDPFNSDFNSNGNIPKNFVDEEIPAPTDKEVISNKYDEKIYLLENINKNSTEKIETLISLFEDKNFKLLDEEKQENCINLLAENYRKEYSEKKNLNSNKTFEEIKKIFKKQPQLKDNNILQPIYNYYNKKQPQQNSEKIISNFEIIKKDSEKETIKSLSPTKTKTRIWNPTTKGNSIKDKFIAIVKSLCNGTIKEKEFREEINEEIQKNPKSKSINNLKEEIGDSYNREIKDLKDKLNQLDTNKEIQNTNTKIKNLNKEIAEFVSQNPEIKEYFKKNSIIEEKVKTR